MTPNKVVRKCQWLHVGEDTAGDLFWCATCGDLKSTAEPEQYNRPEWSAKSDYSEICDGC